MLKAVGDEGDVVSERALAGAGTPGEPPGEDPGDGSILAGETARGRANATLRQWFQQVKVFSNAPWRVVVEVLEEQASLTPDWKVARTDNGWWRWSNAKTGQQFRLSDTHGEIRLYAQELGGGAGHGDMEYAVLK